MATTISAIIAGLVFLGGCFFLALLAIGALIFVKSRQKGVVFRDGISKEEEEMIKEAIQEAVQEEANLERASKVIEKLKKGIDFVSKKQSQIKETP